MDGNALDPPPIVKLLPPEQERRLQKLNTKLSSLRKLQEERQNSDELKTLFQRWHESPSTSARLHQDVPADLHAHWSFDKIEGDEIKSLRGDRPPGKLIENPEKVPGKIGDGQNRRPCRGRTCFRC